MKRPAIAIILLAGIFAIGIASFFYLKGSCNRMIEHLDAVLENAEAENTEKVTAYSALANAQWEKEEFFFNISVGLKDSNEVISALRQMTYFSEKGDMESVILFAEECKVTLLRIKESAEPKISTIL